MGSGWLPIGPAEGYRCSPKSDVLAVLRAKRLESQTFFVKGLQAGTGRADGALRSGLRRLGGAALRRHGAGLQERAGLGDPGSFLQAGNVIGPVMATPVDEERWRTRHPADARGVDVARHPVGVRVARELAA